MSDKAVAKRQDAPPAVVGETAAIMSMIERMATDATISIERVEQTFAFYQRVQADRAKQAFYAAFAEMQKDLPAVERTGTGHNSKKYARFEDFIEAIKPTLTAHGFSLSHRIKQPSATLIEVTAILAHRDGHAEETSIALPPDASGNKTPVHALGSAISYGKRYTGLLIIGVATADEDDDGKAAGAGQLISGEQEDEIAALVEDFDSEQLEGFCKYFKIKSLSELKAADFERAKAAIAKSRAKRAP
jgi:hypothetical protein